MKETFIVVFKDGSKLQVTYPQDSYNLFKLRIISHASIDNVKEIIGFGKIAQTLRARYGLSAEKGLSDLGIVQETTGLTKEQINKHKNEVISRLEKLRKKHLD